MINDPINTLTTRFEAQRQAFENEKNPSLKTRLSRLDRLLALTESNEDAIARAINADFRCRSTHETRLAELFIIRSGIRHAQKHLKQWMRKRRIATGLQFMPGSNRLIAQPLGVVGVVSPWNYPFQLAIGPTLAALAAGNRVLIKPSELTPQLSALLETLVAANFDSHELCVVNGDAEVGKAFVNLPFDHLFFTGSTSVGRQVAISAANNLTPVTLELGGKSPAIFDESCNIAMAARRLAFGKLLNAGQTCIAPDYLLVPAGTALTVAAAIGAAVKQMFPTLVSNPDYTAIISAQHRQRLASLVLEAREAGAQVIEFNPAQESFEQNSEKFPPTVVINPKMDTRLMREEIFGPVLPIIEYTDIREAIFKVNQADRPLALYWFGSDPVNRDQVLQQTHAGGVTVNDCLWHLAQENQPFGGVGQSGMGAYHGEWGFNTFSKHKPVFYQARWNGTSIFYPPYKKTFDRLLTILKRIT